VSRIPHCVETLTDGGEFVDLKGGPLFIPRKILVLMTVITTVDTRLTQTAYKHAPQLRT
jgi:hypothetical protein